MTPATFHAEIALRRQIERVAAERRARPPGGRIPEDYVFEEGDDGRSVKLSELFGDKSVLMLYSYMYGPKMAQSCPSCSSILDRLDGQVHHIEQRVAIAAVARSPITRVRTIARERGWRRLRLLSSASNSYHRDCYGEDAKGDQWPILNAFVRAPDGAIRHAYATESAFAPRDPGQDPRYVDAIWPLWECSISLLSSAPAGGRPAPCSSQGQALDEPATTALSRRKPGPTDPPSTTSCASLFTHIKSVIFYQ